MNPVAVTYSNWITKWKWSECDQLQPIKKSENISSEEISVNWNFSLQFSVHEDSLEIE